MNSGDRITAVLCGSSGHFCYAVDSPEFARVDVLAAVFDRTEAVPGWISQKNIPVFDISGADGVFERFKPSIAIINTIFAYNGRLAESAVARGIHVFLEKPAAITLEGLESLRQTYYRANESGRVCVGGMFGIRYEPAFVRLKEFIDGGGLGEPILVETSKSYKLGRRAPFTADRKLYGGTIPWAAIHAIEWTSWLTGEKYLSVSALHRRTSNHGLGDFETAAAAVLEMTGGVIGLVGTDMIRPASAPTHGDDRIRITIGRWLNNPRLRAVFNGSREPEKAGEGVTRDIFGEFIGWALDGSPTENDAEVLFSATRTALTARESADGGGLRLKI